MIQRLQHRNRFPVPQGEQMDDDQQATPIFDLIAQALHKYDILGSAKYNDLAYEETVVWLLQHLPAAHDVHSVERLIGQAFAEQQGSHQFESEEVLRMQALAEDIFECWTTYRQRNETSAFTQQTHARSRMRRFYYPANR